MAVAARLTGLGGLTYNPFAGLPAPEFSVGGALLALATAWPAARVILGTHSAKAPEPETALIEVAP
ncbi:MAG: hypothetical protein IH609_00830 [Dehalococcoidia bacterium]|nr:hypothetical protein [Dehalococcoidia bacterium]